MPQEYKLLLKHVGQANYSNDLECYERHGGYAALRQALTIAPALVPTNSSGTTPSSSHAFNTPRWDNPRAAPPEATKAIFKRCTLQT